MRPLSLSPSRSIGFRLGSHSRVGVTSFPLLSVSLKKDRAGNKDAIPAQVLQARGRDRSEAPRDFSRDGAIRDGGRVLLSGSEINRDLSFSQDQGLGPDPQHDR